MASVSNYPVNRTDFRIIRGVQNEILFFVRDIDRNPASTSAFQSVTINIVDSNSSTLLMTRNLSVVDATTALYQLTILPSETANWETGPLRWSISVTRTDGSTVMLWTDMNYGPYSKLEVTDGPTPGPAVPQIIDPSTFTLNNGVTYSSSLPGAAQFGYQNGMQTFAIYPNSFTGSLEIEGSLQSQPQTDSDWFGLVTHTYDASSTLDTISVQGNYLWLRILLTTTSGTINQIQYKN